MIVKLGEKELAFIEKGRKVSKEAHESINQKRKYTGEPYWRHPDRVADTVLAVLTESQCTEIRSPEEIANMVVAASLHDVLEDVYPTNWHYSPTRILVGFGLEVLELVLELTDISTMVDENRAARKTLDRQRLMKISPDGKLIKMADLLDNSFSIREHDSNFFKLFREESLLLMEHLKEGSQYLYLELRYSLNLRKNNS